MGNITLTIAIPTYKRPQLLALLLNSIVQDIAQWPDDFELIVSDNASLDETCTVVSSYSQKGLPIKYVVNETNIGPDRNIDACFNLASGKYVWVIGDDEILYRGAVQYVLELCRAKQFGVLHLSSRGFYQGQQGLIMPLAKPNTVKIKKFGRSKFIRAANVRLTFISANVINKKAVLRETQNFTEKANGLHDTNMGQLAWIFSAIKAESTNYFVPTPLFGALGGNFSEYDVVRVFGVNLVSITKKYFHDLCPEAGRIMENAVVTMLLPSILMAPLQPSQRTNELKYKNIVGAAEKIFFDNLYFRLFIRPIFVGPALFRKLGFLFIRAFNKFNKTLDFALL